MFRVKKAALAALLALFLFLASTALAGEGRLNRGTLHDEAIKLLQAKKYSESIRKYAVLVKSDPGDMIALYNIACACSLMGKKERAVAFLERSVEEGYLDFDHMKADPDLDPIRDMEGYGRILANREKYVRASDRKREQKYRDLLGDKYTFLKDEKHRFLLVTNVEPADRTRLAEMLRNYAKAHWRDFFPHKPGFLVTVLVPRNWDDYSKKFGGRRGAAGFYSHGARTLTANRATGSGTLIHEWTHALHYGDQDALKQRHPGWIVEGFGSLYEGCTIRNDGTAVGMVNWRLRAVQYALNRRSEIYIPWKRLMDPKRNVFRSGDQLTVSMAYAEARYIFYYLQDKKVLRKFCSLYRKRYKEDPSGAKFVAEVLGKPIEDAEREWKQWVKSVPAPSGPTPAPKLKVRIGIYMDPVEGGVSVTRLVPDSPAVRAGLEEGDVIVKAGDKPVRTTSDVQFAMWKKKPGDKLKLEVRRKGKTLSIDVVLAKRN
ncbi:MAG: PDZ domain-containing protein [Planctomycetota bacterium]|jgi:tetratricopeptide (TPR) repeat protein